MRGPLEAHTGDVGAVSFSPDSSRVVSGSDDGTICVWDVETGELVFGPFQGHNGSSWINSVAYSPDGKRITSGSGDKNHGDQTIRVWNASGNTLEPISQPLSGYLSWYNAISYSSDGKRLAAASQNSTLRVWDLVTRDSTLLYGHTDDVVTVAFSPIPHDHRVVSGSFDGTVRIWDASSGQPVGDPLKGHTDSVLCVAFSPDGSYVASGADDGTVRIWEVKTPWDAKMLGRVFGAAYRASILSVAFSPSGKRVVASATDGAIWVWDILQDKLSAKDTGSEVRNLFFFAPFRYLLRVLKICPWWYDGALGRFRG